MKRITKTLAVVTLVFGSLITFPVYIPWMAGVWIVCSMRALVSNKPMWPWLIGCVAIVAIKRPGFTLPWLVFSALLVVVALLDWQKIRRKVACVDWRRGLVYVLLLAGATTNYGVQRWFGSRTQLRRQVDGRAIACLGDSLTDFGYPQELERLISVPVADFGVNGITTDAGIKMIPEILATDPQLVVIELGGHDYNGAGKSRSATRLNLIKLIEAFDDHGVAVVLVEIPRGFVSDPYDGLERELAAKYDLQLIDDALIRSFIFNSPLLPPGIWRPAEKRYSDDGLHPNGLGNQRFARVVCDSLETIFGPSIRHQRF